MKKLYTLWVMLWFYAAIASAQTTTIVYEYDGAGNRVLRKVDRITMSPLSAGNASDTTGLHKQTELDNLNYTEDINGVTFNLFPNPTEGRFTVEMKNGHSEDQISIYLYSVTGELIYSTTRVEPCTIVDISHKENGTYLLTLVVNRNKRTCKVVKQ